MPLYKTIAPNSQTTVKIWKITESYEELMQLLDLNDESLLRVSSMKSAIHKRGFLSIRHLLREFDYTDKDLYYDENGKPHLKDGKFISISHSFIFSGIIISEVPVGIDIEKQRSKIKLIAKKFVDYESQYLSDSDEEYIRKLTLIWCIKESLYKLYATPGLSFKLHTLVLPFMIEDQSTKSWIDYNNDKKDFNSEYLEFDGFSCAYVI
jgi:phosphopantetheinyl transferase